MQVSWMPWFTFDSLVWAQLFLLLFGMSPPGNLIYLLVLWMLSLPVLQVGILVLSLGPSGSVVAWYLDLAWQYPLIPLPKSPSLCCSLGTSGPCLISATQ